MNTYILITGASSGIGFEMAYQLAAKQYSLILTARREDRLIAMQQDLQQRYQVEVFYFAVDLADPKNAASLYHQLQSKKYVISHLVNNAGFGDYGNFLDTALDKELSMIQLNISSLVVLTKLFAQDMAQRGQGRIMNVASLLAFIPFPYYSVYSATKSFVLAFSETIAAELDGTGVIVTVLCPGTVETDFHTSQMRQTNAMSANKPKPAKDVAAAGVHLLLQGNGKKIVGLNNWIISNLPRFTPDNIMIKIKKHLASKKS